jgi:hypothetical protein
LNCGVEARASPMVQARQVSQGQRGNTSPVREELPEVPKSSVLVQDTKLGAKVRRTPQPVSLGIRSKPSHLSELSESSESLARVQDTKLNARVSRNHTEHIFSRHECPGGPREIWRRQDRLGHGSFGTVWLEKCDNPCRRDTPVLRAVKEIHLRSEPNNSVDYTRELDAFAKFSQPKVSPPFLANTKC